MRFRFGEFTLDAVRRELRRGAEEIHLKPKTFQLLQFLLEKSPAVISREEIHDHLWPDAFVDSGSIHSLIFQLRQALDDEPHEIVRTSYGTGFSIGVAVARDEGDAASGFEVIYGDHRFRLAEGENLIGRDWKARVRIDDPSISRHHARITVTGGEAILEDLGSKNGTSARGQRVRRATPVADGDRIIFGLVVTVFRALGSPPKTETAPVASALRP